MLKKDKTLILAQPKLGFLYSLKEAASRLFYSIVIYFLEDDLRFRIIVVKKNVKFSVYIRCTS